LGEGVDIPEADSVIIMYPKVSTIEIIQMVLRPGRWYKNKTLFHILIPVLSGEDIDGLERVLSALANIDEKILSEIELKIRRPISSHSDISNSIYMDEEIENIIIEDYNGGDIKEINECFIRVRNRMFGNELTYEQMKNKIANLENKPKNKSEYYDLCNKDSIFPKDPEEYYKSGWKEWIDYLGIERIYYDLETCKKRVTELKKEIKETDLSKICEILCKMDSMFPPNEMWIDYYMKEGVYRLDDIIKISIKKKISSL